MHELSEWFIYNKLSINMEKTTYMIFKPYSIINDIIKNQNLLLFADNVLIKRRPTSIIKYLGVFIDEMLSWKHHIISLITNNSRFIGAIYSKRSLIPYSCRRNLNFALIHSRLIYGAADGCVMCTKNSNVISYDFM